MSVLLQSRGAGILPVQLAHFVAPGRAGHPARRAGASRVPQVAGAWIALTADTPGAGFSQLRTSPAAALARFQVECHTLPGSLRAGSFGVLSRLPGDADPLAGCRHRRCNLEMACRHWSIHGTDSDFASPFGGWCVRGSRGGHFTRMIAVWSPGRTGRPASTSVAAPARFSASKSGHLTRYSARREGNSSCRKIFRWVARQRTWFQSGLDCFALVNLSRLLRGRH